MTRATAGFVEFALASREAAFPAKARAMAIDAITDLLGCMVAGAGEHLASMLDALVFDVPADLAHRSRSQADTLHLKTARSTTAHSHTPSTTTM